MKLFSRFSKQGTIKKVQEQLTGNKARAAFLVQCGYPNQPQGLMQRLSARLDDLLPIKTDALSQAAFSRLFGPGVVEQARNEPLLFPADSNANLWPWLSGQGGLRLARAAFMDEQFQRPFNRWLEAMLAAAKNMAGVGWQDQRLIACRIINLLFALRFINHKLLPDVCADCLLHLYLAAQVLAQQLSESPEAGPMQAEPAAALIMLGLACDFMQESETWLEQGSSRLGPALTSLGLSQQNFSAAYLNSALQSACLVQWLALPRQLALPQLMAGITKLAPLVRALAPPWADDGQLNNYGPLNFASTPLSGEAANLAALLLSAPDLRGPRRMSELVFWLLGETAFASLRQLAGGVAPGAIDIPQAGMSGLCTRWRYHSLGVWLITAPRNGGEKVDWPLNHGLGLCLFRQGRPLLMAPAKVNKGPLAKFTLSRQAMNALLLDEKAPAMGLVEVESLEQKQGQFFMAASFSGYAGVMLRRRIFLDEPVINIVDQIHASGQHLCQVYFHFPPQALVVPAPRGGFIIELNEEKWWFKSDPRAQVNLVQGQANPPLGWALSIGNSMLPSPTIVLQAQTVGSTRLNCSLALLEY